MPQPYMQTPSTHYYVEFGGQVAYIETHPNSTQIFIVSAWMYD